MLFRSRPLRTDNGTAILGGGAGTPSLTPAQPTAAPQPTMTRVLAEATIELRRRQLEAQNHPAAIIMPPTALGNALKAPPAPTPGR